MITLEAARDAILAAIAPLPPERVHLLDALGRVLAAPLRASVDLPAFDNAAMDGYAVRWAEVSGARESAPVALPVALEAPAGAAPAALPSGCAARVMTGAPLPQGADTVIMREDTDEADPARIRVLRLPQAGPGAHIRRRGEQVRQGDPVLGSGALLDAGALGVLASFGHAVVSVARRPRVAIVSTGDELVELGQVPGPGQIVNTSALTLHALVREAGGEPILLPIARDTLEETLEVFQQALSSADLVVSTGGVSVGDRDRVKEAMEALCDELTFWRVRVKPGKPLAFGLARGRRTPLIGLPGNPVSSWVGFWHFVRPAIRAAQGDPSPLLPQLGATLTAPLRSTAERLDLQRGVLRWSPEGSPTFTPCGDQGSASLLSTTQVNAIAHVPVGVARMEAGEVVCVDVLSVAQCRV